MVFGFFCAGSVQALSTSRMKRLYLLTSRVSATLHSRLAKHSATNGGATRSAGAGVSLNLSNFSTSRPEQLPISTTLAASSSAGKTNRFVVVVINKKTREVLSQVPEEYVLRLAEDLKKTG